MARLNPARLPQAQDKAKALVRSLRQAPSVIPRRAGAGVALAVAAALTALAPTAAEAQSACGERNQLIERLEKEFSEKRRAIALSADGGVIEVLAAPTGSWTILITHPNGRTCVVAVGEAWEDLPMVVSGPAV